MMKYLKQAEVQDADSGEDVDESAFVLEARLKELRQHRAEVQDPRSDGYADLMLEEGRLLIRLDKMPEAWEVARAAFDTVPSSTSRWGATAASTTRAGPP